MIEQSTELTTTLPPSDPFAGSGLASPVLAPPNPDGLTLTQLENMLSDLRFQPKWREEADKSGDYYDGHQLTFERLERMNRLGIPPLVTNLIRPTIDAVLGLEAKTRTDWRVIEEDYATPVPEPVLNALNQKLTEAERESRADRSIADAHASQIKTGLGWIEVSRSTDALSYPYRVAQVHRNEIWWDWRSKNPDLTDARYLVRKRRFDQDELIALMPEHEAVIKNAVGDRFRTWQWDTKDLYDPVLAYAAEVERLSNIEEDDWRDAERHRATLFEVWYRKWTRGLVMKLPNGRVVPFNESNQKHVMAVQAGLIKPREATYSEIRVAFYLGPHQLYDFKSPYSHKFYPYVPFWGFREDKTGIPYGLIRGMTSPQDVVNSADAKMHWMLNARRLIASSDSIDTRHNSWRQVQDELARPDAVILLDPSKPTSTFKVESDFQLTQQQYARRMQAANDIENAGGVFKAMMGKEGGATSGIAINALIEQGSVTLAEINDNYRFARRQVGEMLFSMVHEDLIGQPTTIHVPESFGARRKKPVMINQPRPDGGMDNNVALVNAKVVLNDVPSTPAFRAQQLQVLSEVVKSLPPEMQMMTIDVLVKLTDVPEKDLLIERLRKAAGIQDIPPEEEEAAMAAQQEQAAKLAAMQEEAMVLAMEETEAKVRELNAKAAKLEAEASAAGGMPPAEMQKIAAEIERVREEGMKQVQALTEQLQVAQVEAANKSREIDSRAAVEVEKAKIGAEAQVQVAAIQNDSSKHIDALMKRLDAIGGEVKDAAQQATKANQAAEAAAKAADKVSADAKVNAAVEKAKAAEKPAKEEKPAEPPAPTIINIQVDAKTGETKKTVTVQRDAKGNITGAQVSENADTK